MKMKMSVNISDYYIWCMRIIYEVNKTKNDTQKSYTNKKKRNKKVSSQGANNNKNNNSINNNNYVNMKNE